MTDEQAMTRAVLADPGDDLPRLTLADWLDDHGQPERAEFIRLQIEYDRWFDPHERAPRAESLIKRVGELWGAGLGESFDMFGLESRMDWENTAGEPGVVIVRRGFPAEVRCSLVRFVGGPCGRCDVLGVSVGSFPLPTGGDEPCPGCAGERVVPGLARALFAAHPLVRVVLTGRLPSQLHDGEWAWASERCLSHATELNPAARLPNDLWDLLPGTLPGRQFWSAFYPTAAAARDALSAACVQWGRELAGLDPLPEER